MKKFIFSTLEGWQVLTGDEAYETYGRKGYHNLPLFKADGKNIFELKGSEYKMIQDFFSETAAQKTIAEFAADDDDNVVFYETLADAEKSIREAYDGEPGLEELMADLRRAVAGALE